MCVTVKSRNLTQSNIKAGVLKGKEILLFKNPPLCPPYPKAVPRIGTGHGTYFWVIQNFKTMNLTTEERASAVLASRSDYKKKIKANKKKKIILYLI